MRLTEFWDRMEGALGPAYARFWASQHVLADLDQRTVDQALAAGVPAKQVWLVVWAELGLPARDR